MTEFERAYQGLNVSQKKAVDTIEGPVMVVAGPGTGKTQVLALRIAHILQKTDVGADAVLCLTFTRSGVSAMKDRLERYMANDARKVHVTTFHSFAASLIENYYTLLDFDTIPELLDDTQAVLLVDELLHNHEWEYIRPRTNPAQYFGDLKQLISVLKRERMTPALFLVELEHEIQSLQEDPDSISTRGESKGNLKKEIEKKIESLERTKEVVLFYRLYEALKKERSLMDYDDVLEYAVLLVEQSEDVRAELRETYQYILVDEHQDSSGVQNAFLKAVWADVEQPNIFVVGDDRQLIYGFSGASLSYFEEFATFFGKATLVTLSENYRSTERILALADDLLQSSVSTEPLKSNTSGDAVVGLYQYQYERDELLGAVHYFKTAIQEGIAPEECALLVPKNRHVRSAVALLRAAGLPVSTEGSVSLFAQSETQALLRVLGIIAHPYDHIALAESILDYRSGIVPMDGHAFLYAQKGKPFSIETMEAWGSDQGLFSGTSSVAVWGRTLRQWIAQSAQLRTSELVSTIGTALLIAQEQSHDSLLRTVEIVRSLLHTVTVWEERQKESTLSAYLLYITRLQSYNHDMPVASFGMAQGVKVMTLHKSKGLEYSHVWIAHMNEEVVMAQKRSAFTLPETIKERLSERDKASVTRELYVAITRAKKECTLSYASLGYEGRTLMLSEILADLPKTHFRTKDSTETEKELLSHGLREYILLPQKETSATLQDVYSFVVDRYSDVKVSVTLLNNFFECPWKWYFRNFLKLPEIKSVSLALGSAVHSTIEYLLKASEKPSEILIGEKIALALAHEGVVDQKELHRLSVAAKKAIERWVTLYYPGLAENRTSERSVSFRDPAFPRLSMYGKIDLTERFPDGAIMVTDFKTGKPKSVSDIEKITDEGRLSDYMRQLAMYSYLVRGAEEKEVFRSRLLFVEADKTEKHSLYETHIGAEQIDLLIRDIKEYDQLLQSGAWVTRPCHHKGYGVQTECEYCTMAKVFKQ